MNCFVNWSNHPFEKWDKAQLEAARALGDLVYIPFPDVAPTGSTAEIIERAKACVQELLGRYPDPDSVVIMVQGEMTLLYHILKLLERAGYRVVAATSDRDVQVLPDGKELKTFKFRAFRDYFSRD